ncbi:MAG: spore coat U domain-containing protein [Beijerinckiaceae bacterium]|nr:spore coat U domain-containing protein [Beijerinckiaceae bacterium]
MLAFAMASLLCGEAQAGTATASLTVQITITASCTINAATLDFGTNAGTALVAGNIDASTTTSVTCTTGSPYAIGMDNGSNVLVTQRRMKSGANYLNYNLYVDSGRTQAWTTSASSTTCASANSCYLGTGNGSAQSINIYGRAPVNATAPAPGVYVDTVTMTITY